MKLVVTGKVVVAEEAAAAAVGVEVEVADVVVQVVDVVALTSRVLLMTKARRYRGNERRPTRAQARTTTARLNVGRRWLEQDFRLVDGILYLHKSVAYGTWYMSSCASRLETPIDSAIMTEV
jgi:hypothetical protein